MFLLVPNPVTLPSMFLLVPNPAILAGGFLLVPNPANLLGLKRLFYITVHMTSLFQSSLDSILVSIAGFHLRGLGSIPGVGDESISKN